ncbi:hypothetical protein Gogos_009428 [Gossypium gossypioides]|uniref:MADS-box domain-containing protein n=1 Tax=Gossypium gossypioides TaxID=34282 RepID=A0A7J9CEX5_GOSGO|nr:hypothetical protein [Gossypium gossypioides]
MARKKVKLAWIENNSTRKANLKKKRLGLVKKVDSATLSFGGDAQVLHLTTDYPLSRLSARVNFDGETNRKCVERNSEMGLFRDKKCPPNSHHEI